MRAVVGFLAGLSLALAWLAPVTRAAAALPTPASLLGFEPCADYKLATYEAIGTYLRALDAASDRMILVDIGRSVEGRPLRLAVISSPRNLARLEHYRRIAATLALGRREGQVLTEQAARALAREGRAVVWVDFGLHSSEVAHGQAAPLFAWRMVSGETGEIRQIRDDVMPAEVSAFFAHGLAFPPAAPRAPGEVETWPSGAQVAAAYARDGLLQSGWQQGGDRLAGRGALVELRIGRGRVVLVGFRAQHRAQSHATFKFLFNALLAPPPDTPSATVNSPR